jgi:competence protein ComEC
MKLPAVAIAALFAGGIAFGLHPAITRHATSHLLLLTLICSAASGIILGLALLRTATLFPTAICSGLAWLTLGVLGSCIAEQPRAASHVLSLVEASQLDLETPLRWHGRLRDEPTKLPWGYGYEVSLSGVEYQSAFLPATGGLRVSFSAHPNQQPPPEIHAGDEITLVAQAKLPQVFRNAGAFDRRAYLAEQEIHLTAILRAPELLELVSSPAPTFATRLARLRKNARDNIDTIFAANPGAAALLRAMLLGDRSFVDTTEATDFQKAGIFHVLVVAGLHVSAIAVLLFWAGRKLRLSPSVTIVFTLVLLFSYVAVVEQRPPVLRAALMTALVVLGGFFFRRLDLLNSAAISFVLLLAANPLAIRDSSFQLTFVAIGCIAGLAVPLLNGTLQPYVRALKGWRDVTRDASHEPRAAQFRIDLRSAALWISSRLPASVRSFAEYSLAGGLALAFRVSELLALTIVLQIGMLPAMAADFHRITLAASAANVLAVPLLGVVVPAGFLTLLCGAVFPALGKCLAVPVGWMTILLVQIARWFAHFPNWSYRVPGPPLAVSVLFFLVLASVCVATRMQPPLRTWALRLSSVVLLVLAAVVAIFPFAPQWAKGQLEVSVLDVGQGDSLFVVTPGGKTMLIDGGGAFGGFPGREERGGIDPGEEAVSPYLWSRGFQKLDVVALTHAHQDHLGGLNAILENFHVGKLWIGRDVSSAAMGKLESIARGKNILIEHELRGKHFLWDGVSGDFLWPEIAPEEIAPAAKNNDSLVLRLHFGERTILLPGDAEKQTERQLLAENSPGTLRADVLKIGHHGSKNSTTPDLLAAVRPKIGVISAGKDNPYGHPSAELLERLKNAGVRILRTDQEGAVRILTDGQSLEISCYVACPAGTEDAASVRAQVPYQKQNNQ